MAFNSLMHERNIYKVRPDFKQISIDFPYFRKYAVPDLKGRIRIDFTDTNALRMLTQILLKKDFDLSVEIPDGFLIPTVPQRLNYILWLEDLVSSLPNPSTKITGIDIGTGPCAIFSLLGAKKNGWKFIATESSDEALHWAVTNIEANNLQAHIKVIKVNSDSILGEVLAPNEESFDFCLCNPPFFENIEEIRRKKKRCEETIADVAKKEEIFAEGGELAFVRNIIKDSCIYKERIRIYSSMFGKKKNFLQISKELKDIEGVKFTTTEFCQGNTVRWGIAWTFLESLEFKELQVKKVKPKKPKKPLTCRIHQPSDDPRISVKTLCIEIKNILKVLEISFSVVRASKKYAEIELKTNKNTWSHQRRKRRAMMREKRDSFNKADSSSCNVASVAGSKDINVHETKLSSVLCGELNSSNSLFHSQMNDGNMVKSEENKEQKLIDNVDICQFSEQDLVTVISHNGVSSGNSNIDLTINISGNTSIEKLAQSENNLPPKKTFAVSLDTKNFEVNCEENTHPPNQEFKNDCLTDEGTNICDSESKSGLSNCNTSCELNSSCHSKRKVEVDDDSSVSCKKVNLDVSSENEFGFSGENLETGYLLCCTLKLIKVKDGILFEMNCLSEVNREPMHQVFQYLKNKLRLS